MKIGLVLVAILIGSLVLGIYSIKPCQCEAAKVKIGLFYYVWYNGTLGQGHWNGTPPNDPNSTQWTVVDEPILGFYNSSDPKTIRQHLEWFKELGIDFLIISWWGMGSFEDAVTKEVFQQASVDFPSLKLVIMVEGFNDSADNYDFGYIRSYIKTTYYNIYPNTFLSINNRPLICWWNAENMTGTLERPRPDRVIQIHNDSFFENRILGHNSYVDWYAWTPSTVNPSENPVLSRDNFTVVEPRFDYSHINSTHPPYDPFYNEDLYDKQWTQVINWNESQSAKYVAIYSWNEYHERSQTEPHIGPDGTYHLSPFAKTYHYIQILPEFSPLLMIPLFMASTVLALVISKRKRQNWT